MNFQLKGDDDVHGKEENGFVALKLDHDEDFYECLNKAIVDFNIKSGYILMGIGMLKDSEIGFFDARGTKDEPSYWVPFLYRSALNLVQGKADAS